LDGRLIQFGQNNGSEISIENLNSGLYILILKLDSEEFFRQNLIKL